MASLKKEGTMMTLYYGTSVILADEIVKEGLKPCNEGCLGSGLYLSTLDKASKRALDAPLRLEGEGAVVFKVEVRVKNPKYIKEEDKEGKWKKEGHDAVCIGQTSSSKLEEWCIADVSQCKLLSKAIIYYGKMYVTEDDFLPIKQLAKNRPTCPGRSNWGRHHPAEDGERVTCPNCMEHRCSNCIHVHLAHCRGWSVAGLAKQLK